MLDIKNSNNDKEPTSTNTSDESGAKEAKDSENISVPKSLIETMQQEIAELKKGQKEIKDESKKDKPKPASESVVRLRNYKGSLVVGFNKKRGAWRYYDKNRREERLKMEIFIRQRDKKIRKEEVDYGFFMEDTPSIEVPLLKVKSTPIVKELGYIAVKEVVEYNTVDTPNKVMQKVISSADTFVVRLPDGDKYELDSEFINI